MGAGLVAVRDGTRDLGLELGNTFVQFVVRVTIETFPGELAGQVARYAGKVFIHARRIERAALAVNRLRS